MTADQLTDADAAWLSLLLEVLSASPACRRFIAGEIEEAAAEAASKATEADLAREYERGLVEGCRRARSCRSGLEPDVFLKAVREI